MDRPDGAYALAFAVALLGGGLAQWALRGRLGGPREIVGRVTELPPLIGHVERALYTGAFLAGEPLFIGLWLTLKIVGASDIIARSFGPDTRSNGIEGRVEFRDHARTTYQRFLILSGLSLLWSAGGWTIAEAVIDDHIARAAVVFGGLVLGTAFLWCVSPGTRSRWPRWIPRSEPDPPSESSP